MLEKMPSWSEYHSSVRSAGTSWASDTSASKMMFSLCAKTSLLLGLSKTKDGGDPTEYRMLLLQVLRRHLPPAW